MHVGSVVEGVYNVKSAAACRSIPVHREEIYAKIRHREQPSLQIGSHVGNEDHEARM
jgi:sRNA-binding carbon storage regulator CsrA